ncbi:MAG: hypothetical protein GXC73_17885 [Chitinophagaceae bacterium]|nr:hypothetical protein [Chitinophagaceae bacterium]
MNYEHLSDKDLQEYALQKQNCYPGIMEHIQQCISCQIKAEQYSTLFAAMQDLEKPSFDFDLSAEIIPQLQVKKKPVSHSPVYLSIALIAFAFVLVTILFGNAFLSLFLSMAPILFALIMTTVSCIAAIIIIDMYKKHKAKMNSLNYY